MSKKNCRRTPAEQALHKEAVRLRNMTDKQLVEEFHRAAEPGMARSVPSVAQAGAEADTPIGDTSAVRPLQTENARGLRGRLPTKLRSLRRRLGWYD